MSLPRRALVYVEAVEAALADPHPAMAFDFDVCLVLALLDRESGLCTYLTPAGPAGTGDQGHGRGIAQFDDRPHPGSYVDENGLTNDQWIAASDDWKDPEKSILRCVRQLRWAANELAGSCADPSWAVSGAVCAYNAGVAKAKAILEGLAATCSLDFVQGALDVPTTGHDYVTDIFRRRGKFLSS